MESQAFTSQTGTFRLSNSSICLRFDIANWPLEPKTQWVIQHWSRPKVCVLCPLLWHPVMDGIDLYNLGQYDRTVPSWNVVIRIILKPKREQIRRSFCSLAVRRAIISSNVTDGQILLHQIKRHKIKKMHMENVGMVFKDLFTFIYPMHLGMRVCKDLSTFIYPMQLSMSVKSNCQWLQPKLDLIDNPPKNEIWLWVCLSAQWSLFLHFLRFYGSYSRIFVLRNPPYCLSFNLSFIH